MVMDNQYSNMGLVPERIRNDKDADNALSALDKLSTVKFDAMRFNDCIDTLRTYITSTAGQRGELREISEEEITAMFDPAPVFKESFHWIVGWLQDKFPHGVKIK